jgi:hypothetical protein
VDRRGYRRPARFRYKGGVTSAGDRDGTVFQWHISDAASPHPILPSGPGHPSFGYSEYGVPDNVDTAPGRFFGGRVLLQRSRDFQIDPLPTEPLG